MKIGTNDIIRSFSAWQLSIDREKQSVAMETRLIQSCQAAW